MTGDVTKWLDGLTRRDEAAAQALWQHYFEKLLRLARRRLEGLPRREADEEDVVLSAMHSFCQGVAAGRFPQLKDRHDLWKLLVTITAHKALAQFKRQRARKRGSGRVRGQSAFLGMDSSTAQAGIERIIGEEPTPAFAAMVVEEYRLMLGSLCDERLRAIAVWKMEGYSNAEIAEKLGCAERTVERKLRLIRSHWAGKTLDEHAIPDQA